MADATIRDVARRAQVSVASVSRVLNRLDNVSEETRARVTEAVRELGYVPHAGARSLSLARTNAIGVVLPDFHGEFFSEIVRGMDREASRRGYMLLLSNVHAGSEQSANAMRAMRGRVDGLVILAPHLSEDELADAVPRGTPAVLINTRGDAGGHPGVRLDNAAGAEAVADHLASLGRTRIVHIAGAAGNIDAQQRADAFRAALQRRGVAVQVIEGDFLEESGEAAIEALLKAGESFDGVFAANDMMASGALQALNRAGLRVPEDVAVVGFDDVPLARHIGLTTVQVHIAELGARALDRLISILEGKEDPGGQELHKPELVIRSTTDPKANPR
ncbi:LacI family DNA-binding transcriptional regulator [Sphingomonas daechungensis]|uniref:LacI family DNA-binding transcriptional regulator n=1 Tax=Sphingomonas daechungensis TaxID=1176646 RepID=UPI0037847C3A